MNIFEKLEGFMNKFVGPLATKMNSNKTIQAISGGMMGVMPIMLGVAPICILASLPIPGWSELLTNTGIYSVAQMMMIVTLSAIAIYMVVNVAYSYAKAEGENGLTAGIIALGCFLMLIPISVTTNGTTAIETKYIGSDGVFVGMILSIIVAKAYCFLTKKHIVLKLPDSVPPNVSNSLSPMFVAMIIFTICFALKCVLVYTPYGDLFTMFNTLISTPFMSFGATPAAIIAVYTFASIMWFFGVHPSPILSTYGIVLTAANTEAYMAGEAMPYLAIPILYLCLYFSGTGNTIGLSLAIQRCKSERMKALKPITFIPNLFNINEPVIFGVPVMLNPTFIIPMILCTLVPGLIGWAATSLFTFSFNPTIGMPWVTPTIITALLEGGIGLFLLIAVCIAVTTVIWYPFVVMQDKAYLKEEAEMKA